MSQVARGGGQGQSLISLAECLRSHFGPRGKWPPPHLQKAGGRTHIANSSRGRTFRRSGAGVAIRAPATQTLPPVAGRDSVVVSVYLKGLSMVCWRSVHCCLHVHSSSRGRQWHCVPRPTRAKLRFTGVSKRVRPSQRVWARFSGTLRADWRRAGQRYGSSRGDADANRGRQRCRTAKCR